VLDDPIGPSTVSGRIATFSDVGGRTKYPGAGFRAVVYVICGALVIGSVVGLRGSSTVLSTWEVLGLTVAVTCGYLVPVGVGPVGLWRSRRSFVAPPLIVLVATTAPQLTVLVWFAAALASGVWIRRRRFTPGGMAFGASMITLATGAGAWTAQVLGDVPLLAAGAAALVVVRAVTLGLSLALATTALPEGAQTFMRSWSGTDWLWSESAGLGLGAAAVLLRDTSPASMALLAVPYAATVAGSVQRLVLEHIKRRDQAMLALGGRLAAATSPEEIDALLVDAARVTLDAPSARTGDRPPGPDELGVPWRNGWLVAEDRRRPPTFNAPYRPGDRQELDAIVTAGRAALESLTLLERLATLSLQDELTGLPNRRSVQRTLDAAIADHHRGGHPVAVALFDVDHFKAVNDAYGHPTGDAVLRDVARNLEAACRPGDTVARWGGEEFLAVLRAGEPEARRIAERLRAAATCTIPGAQGTQATVSCGVAVVDQKSGSVADAIAAADVALYEAKRQGRDRTVAAS